MLVLAVPASAQSIVVTPSESALPVVATFDGVDVNHSGVFGFFGGSVGEAFAGQTVTTSPSATGDLEVVAGVPTNPLTLQAPTTNNGVWCFQDELQGVADGILDTDIGEGAISFFFQQDHAEIGLELNNTNGGTVTLQFFERNGAPFPGVLPSVGTGGQAFTFTATGGALIAGVTITNADTSGISCDNLRLGPMPVPTLSVTSMSILAIAFLVLGTWIIRRI